MKGTRENEVVIGRQAAQTGLVLALVDQTAGLVDDDQGEDCPGGGRHVSCAFGVRDRMTVGTRHTCWAGLRVSAVRTTWPGEEGRGFTAPAACLADSGREGIRIERNGLRLQV